VALKEEPARTHASYASTLCYTIYECGDANEQLCRSDAAARETPRWQQCAALGCCSYRNIADLPPLRK